MVAGVLPNVRQSWLGKKRDEMMSELMEKLRGGWNRGRSVRGGSGIRKKKRKGRAQQQTDNRRRRQINAVKLEVKNGRRMDKNKGGR